MDKPSQRFKCLWWPGKTKSALLILVLIGHMKNTWQNKGTREGWFLKGVMPGKGASHPCLGDTAGPCIPEVGHWPVMPYEDLYLAVPHPTA